MVHTLLLKLLGLLRLLIHPLLLRNPLRCRGGRLGLCGGLLERRRGDLWLLRLLLEAREHRFVKSGEFFRVLSRDVCAQKEGGVSDD